MDDWNKLSSELKKEIKEVANADRYGLNPVTLFQNIKYSSGSNEELAATFDVPMSLVKKINDKS